MIVIILKMITCLKNVENKLLEKWSKTSSRFNIYYKMLTQTILNWRHMHPKKTQRFKFWFGFSIFWVFELGFEFGFELWLGIISNAIILK